MALRYQFQNQAAAGLDHGLQLHQRQMVRSLTPALIGALFIASVRADLQLTPTISEYQLDGVTFRQLAFSDGEKKITYQSPRGWDYSGSATQLVLHPPNKAQAEATITRIPLPEPGKFDEESLKKNLSSDRIPSPERKEKCNC